MAIDAIVRVSFQTHVPANQAANRALVGDPQAATGTGPFERVGTAAYACTNQPDRAVGNAIADLGSALQQFADKVDFVSVTLVRRSP